MRLSISGARRVLGRLTEPYVLFPLLAVILFGVVWGTTLNMVRVERSIAAAAAASSSQELVDTYEAQVVRALREIDQTLKFLKYTHESGGGRLDLARLREHGLLLPELLFAITVTDPGGTVLASTRPGNLAAVGERDFFRKALASDNVVISRPRASPGAEIESKLHFARRVQRADGAPAGTVIVTVPSSYFVSNYEQSRLGRHGVLGILGRDGVFRARRTGDTVVSGEITDYAAAVPSGAQDASLLAANPWDGVRRYTSVRELFDFPLAVVVGLSEDEQLAAIDERARTYLWRAALGSLALLLLLGGLGWMSWTLSQTRIRSGRALNLRNSAIESSVNAILMIDYSRPDLPIEYVNPA